LGEPFLYNFSVKVIAEDGREVEKVIRTGLRNLRLVREMDQYGDSS